MASYLWLVVCFLFLKAVEARSTVPPTPPPSFYNYFSDKTPYHFIAKSLEKPEGCEPVHLNMLLRHGSRYPSSLHLKKIKDVVESINRFFPDNSTFQYKKLILPWTLPLDYEQAANKELAHSGEREMYKIAKRYLATFPSVLGHPYSNNNYSFVSTDKLRTSQSALAFAQGLFEGSGQLGSTVKYQPVAVKFSGPHDRDKVLRFYDVCPRYRKKAKVSQTRQYSRFLNGPEVLQVARNIERRLNLTGKMNLSPNSVVELFLICAFETQTSGCEGQWCSVFEEEDISVLEYLLDLKNYWARGYGQQINYNMSCPLFTDITETIQHFLEERKPFGVFRFAHTGTVIPLLAMLGLFKDSVPLSASNFHAQRLRKFRVANMVPMSGNVAFVLYDCRGKNESEKEDGCRAQLGKNPHASAVKCKPPRKSGKHGCARKQKVGKSGVVDAKCQKTPKRAGKSVRGYRMQVLVNEVPVTLPACQGKSECTLSDFLDFYAHITMKCHFDTICGKSARRRNKKPARKPL